MTSEHVSSCVRNLKKYVRKVMIERRVWAENTPVCIVTHFLTAYNVCFFCQLTMCDPVTNVSG